MKLKDRLNAAYKAFWGGGDWVNSNRPGNRYTSERYYFEPQTNLNYSALVGDLWLNSAVQACLNWIIRAWPESYPCIKEKDASGKKLEVDDHPLLPLLQWPNQAYDDTVMWAGTILSFWTDGNAYWGINRTRTGDIGELVYIPHDMITPKRRQDSTNVGPDYFEYRPNGIPTVIDPRDIIHYRFGIDPYYSLCGLSGWASVCRHVYTDNEGINYVATTLRRGGKAWMMLSPSDPNASVEDPEALVRMVESKTTGDNRGGVVYLDGDVKATMPPTMRDQSVDTIHRIPETRICALAGIPAITVGLAAGLERSTFENTEQATASAWNTIVAVQRMMGRQLTQQVIRRPMFDGQPNFYQWEAANRGREIWAGFDYTEVRALQPDKQAEWDRIGKAYDRTLLTDDEARVEMGYEPFTKKQRASMIIAQPVQAPPSGTQAQNGGSAKPAANGNGTGGKAWAERVAAELDTLHEASV